MNEFDRDYGDETIYDWEDEDFYLDDESSSEEDDDFEDDPGSFVPNKPFPKDPSLGDALEKEKELVLV